MPMREMDFTEKNLRNRWLGVNPIWYSIQGEVRRHVQRRLERAMAMEVTSHVGCGHYRRSETRRGYRNGSYARSLLTRYGWIEDLMVPRVREGGFESVVFAKYRRRCRVIDQVVLQAFLLGHATRKVRRWFRHLFGSEISPQAVSNIVHELDDEVREFHQRELSNQYRFLYLDGLEVKLRKPLKIKKVVLVALGERLDGSCELISFQVASSESESWWWGFVDDLKSRGLTGGHLKVIVTDGNSGLIKAVRGLYPRVSHQRCTFHKATDLGSHINHRSHRSPIIADALAIFEGETETEVRRRLKRFRATWSKTEPKAVKSLLRDFDACLVYLDYPDPIRTRLKTNNLIERSIEEIRRRIIPMRSFNNLKSADRIIYGIIAYVLNQQKDMPITEFTQIP
jgi:transposase-like protein